MSEGTSNDNNNNPPDKNSEDEGKGDAPQDKVDSVDGKSSSSGRKTQQRDRSPSAMSQSSTALEWDHSADVGAKGTTQSIFEMEAAAIGVGVSHVSSETGAGARPPIEVPSDMSCEVLYGPTFNANKKKQNSRPSSRSSQSNAAVYAYSTPTSSPVPLESLDYSPVGPGTSASCNISEARATVDLSIKARHRKGAYKTSNSGNSSESNTNDALTDARRTPRHAVSGASTDWEYDDEKKSSSKYVADWKTHGITRSEIEYQNRKKSGSSSSTASSVYVLNVKSTVKSKQCEGAAGYSSKKSDSSTPSGSKEESTAQKSTSSSERERKIFQALTRPPPPFFYPPSPDVGSSDSDPSSMCVMVDQLVGALDRSPSKAKKEIQYDILKSHRDYHLEKVWKQISKLDGLNRALMNLKISQREKKEERKSSNFPKPDLRTLYKSRKVHSAHSVQASESFLKPSSKEKAERKPSNPPPELRSLYEAINALPSRKLQSTHSVQATEPPLESGSREQAKKTSSGYVDPNIRMLYEAINALPSKKLQSTQSVQATEPPLQSRSRGRVEKASSNFLEANLRSLYEALNAIPSRKLQSTHSVQATEPPPKSTSREKNEKRASGYLDPNLGSLYKATNARSSRKLQATHSVQVPDDPIPRVHDDKNYRSLPGRGVTNKHPPRIHKSNSEPWGGPQGTLKQVHVTTQRKESVDESRKTYGEYQRGIRTQCTQTTESESARKTPIGFYIPLNYSKKDFVANGRPDGDMVDIKHPKNLQECLKERNPDCYKNMEKRDSILITIKKDRQMQKQSLLKEALENGISPEDIDAYICSELMDGCEEEKRRLKSFWDDYVKAHQLKDNKENVGESDSLHVISVKEMKQRTQRLRMKDPTILEKQKREKEETKKMVYRILQKNFSSNLQRFRRQGNVNVPERLKLGPRPR